MKSVTIVEENEKVLLEKELSQLMESTLKMENELGLVLMERLEE